MTERYLSMTEVAERLGITKGALARYRLPDPDVVVGKARGWREETIDRWNASRPGRGVGGGRPRKNGGYNTSRLSPFARETGRQKGVIPSRSPWD